MLQRVWGEGAPLHYPWMGTLVPLPREVSLAVSITMQAANPFQFSRSTSRNLPNRYPHTCAKRLTHKTIHCLNCNRWETAEMSNGTNHTSTYRLLNRWESASKFTTSHSRTSRVGEEGQASTRPLPTSSICKAHKTPMLGGSLIVQMLQEYHSIFDKVRISVHAASRRWAYFKYPENEP